MPPRFADRYRSRWRLRAATLVLLFAACGCGAPPVAAPPPCDPGSVYEGSGCRVFATRTIERMPTPWTENGRPLTLELVVYRPLGDGPFPTLVFHHGSTGNGDDPALFRQTFTSETVAQVFADQGWMVLFPQRRGRGASDGLYDEGFEADRSRYSCRQEPALAGLSRALDDAEAVHQHVVSRPDVDGTRLMVGGFSRGGILAMAFASRHGLEYRGTVNFVGGWLGEACVDAVAVNRSTFSAARTGPRASLWLYGENDPFYSVGHSRANFDAFIAAGGAGRFQLYRRSDPARSGHLIMNEPSLWQSDVMALIADAVR